MTFPLNSTAELFNYISNLSGVTFDGCIDGNTNIETFEFRLNNNPWIHATSIESKQNKQTLYKIAEKVMNEQYLINILFTKDKIFAKGEILDIVLKTAEIQTYTIDAFLERILKDQEEIQPFEYRAYTELNSLNDTFSHLIAENLKIKEENSHLKYDKNSLANELSETKGKLKSTEESIKTEEVKSQGYAKTILDIAKFSIEKNKLLTEEQIQSLKNHYKENKNEYINGCTISFYKCDKIISSNYYKIEVHLIEGAGVDVLARNKTFVYFDKNGVELPKHENKAEVLFEMPWPALSAILKIPNPIANFRDLFI